jgi:hypothetical protein
MGLFGFLKKTKRQWNDVYNLGNETLLPQGDALINEGLGDLRNEQKTYTEALKNPLGTGPNSASAIFARARGGLSDQATRATNTLGVRLQQQARQSGGSLSPEAQAELAAQNERDTNQNLFEGNVAISNAEASATLTETSKLFDRLDNISKTILGVGSDTRTAGLNLLLAALGGKTSIVNTAINGAVSLSGHAAGASGGGAAPTNSVTGVG